MEDPTSSKDEKLGEKEEPEQSLPEPEDDTGSHDGGGNGDDGWGWGFSPFSTLSDLQKAAAVAAEEISRSAAEVAKTAANRIDDLQKDVENSKSFEDDSESDGESEDEDDKHQKAAALEKLENARGDTFLGQGLKNLDHSVENFASEAWRALGNAWRGGSSFIHKLENSIQQGGLPAAGSVAPSLLETGKAFSTRGMKMLEYVSKETMDLLNPGTGMERDKYVDGNKTEDDEAMEEVTFDRCFYIYGGPEQLEELEALLNHYALLFNRRKEKLSSEKRSEYDVKLKQAQQIFTLDSANDGNSAELEQGKMVEHLADSTDDEIKSFHGSSVNKAAEMAAGFANALAGLSPIDIVKRTSGRLDSLHSEGLHRLSEMCCLAVYQLLILGKSVNKTRVADDHIVKIEWPEAPIEKAKIIRKKTQTMTGYLEDVSISFLTGISDVAEAYTAAIKGVTANPPEVSQGKLIQEKFKAFSENLRASQTSAVGRIQDGLHYLAYLVVSTSMPAA